jgi:hypothetical protein
MKTASTYIAKTESAVRQLFSGVDNYLQILKRSKLPIFTPTFSPDTAEYKTQYEAWKDENQSNLDEVRENNREFIAESFALDILCGAILHVAEKGIELYSNNDNIPDDFKELLSKQTAKYAIGREVRGIRLGLIIYAARNQHTHFDCKEDLRQPSKAIFNKLALQHGSELDESGEPFSDPAFDIANPRLVSFASNVTGLIEWRNYENYSNDLADMLEA